MSTQKKEKNKIASFIDARKFPFFTEYHLFDAYPAGCQVGVVAVAIPIKSAAVERPFLRQKELRPDFVKRWCKIVEIILNIKLLVLLTT